ncbi:MAG: hypothetical protein GY866_24180 [Proteobacteria bacterium]|nr:hypothetical protein [Pseudomonadota bacterium]
MSSLKKICILIVPILMLPFFSQAATLKESLDEAAAYFVNTAVKIQPSHQIVIEVVNYHSNKNDQLAKLIETEFYFALEKRFPQFKLMLLSQSVLGISSKNAVFIRGTYERKGEVTNLRFQAFKGLAEGEILAQTEVKYDTEQTTAKSLVAVLDLEAESLTALQRKAFSDLYRTELSKRDVFGIASSAEVDKMDPDEIQKVYTCTRDACAVVIGEQLGVDQVISTSLVKVSDDLFLLSSKMIDIKDGSMLKSRTVEHGGNIKTLTVAIAALAVQMTGVDSPREEKTAKKADVSPKKPEKRGSTWAGRGRSRSLGWSPIQFSLFAPMQSVDETKDVRGLKINLLYGKNYAVRGADLGFGVSRLNRLRGLQAMVLGGNFVEENVAGGAQMGLVGMSSVKGHINGLQSQVIGYNTSESQIGLQLVLVGMNHSKRELVGAQIGIFNRAESVIGAQIGLVNMCTRLIGVQIGLANFVTEGIFPFLPIVNVSF